MANTIEPSAVCQLKCNSAYRSDSA